MNRNFGVVSRKPSLKPRSSRTSVLSSGYLTFSSMSCFGLIFVKGVRSVSRFTFCMDFSCSSTIC